MIRKLFYNYLVIPFLWLFFRIYSVLNEKARRGWAARRKLFEELERKISHLKASRTRIWFHSSSMGEFEQAKPIIAEIKRLKPDVQIVISFFSPSGYEHSLNYPLADVIVYIPFDSPGNARKFVRIIAPSAAVFIRYDIWPNHLWALQEKNIPTFVVSAQIRKRSYQSMPVVGNFIRSIYNSVDYILTVSERDKDFFRNIGINRPVIEVIGDTRYDQVWKRRSESLKKDLIDTDITKERKIIIIGSSWKEDEKVILPGIILLFSEIKDLLVILVPHEPKEENIEAIERELNGKLSSIRFSHLQHYNNEPVIIIDSVGILMTLYRYGHVAYVGGGFGAGVHNVLEPAVYGMPILCGPRISNSQEALLLKKEGVLFEILFTEDMINYCTRFLTDEENRIQCGNRAFEIVKKNIGATIKCLSYLEKVM